MEVLIYQVVIAVIIFVAGAFGKKTRNVVTFIICLFTVVEVFTFKLAILQFITIFIAYVLSIGYEEKKTEEKTLKKKDEFNYYVIDKNKNEKSESSFGSFSILFIIMSSLFYTFYVFQNKAQLKNESVEIKKDTIVKKKGSKLFDQTYIAQEEDIIEKIEDTVSRQDINKNNYLNDNFPEGYSKYQQVVRLRATSLFTKYKKIDDSWGNWSDRINSKSLIFVSIERNKISICSDDTYRYTDYEIVEIGNAYNEADAKKWEFKCLDKDGISCRIIHSISNQVDLMSQLSIAYSDEIKAYNVNREN